MTAFVLDQGQRRQRGIVFLLLAAIVVAGNAWLSRYPPAALIAPSAAAPEWPVSVDPPIPR